jgi:hypothetical protein
VRLLLVGNRKWSVSWLKILGNGITAEDSPRFLSFFPAPDAGRAESRGIGLGLYLPSIGYALQGGRSGS